MDVRRRLATNLRRIRVARGVSQEALALDAEVDRTYLSGIERMTFNPSLDVLVRIAEALSVDISDLLAVGISDEVQPLKPGRKPRGASR